MTEPVQVYDGEGNEDRENRVCSMVSFLIQNFPNKFGEHDRERLLKQTHEFLEKLEAAKAAGDSPLSILDKSIDKRKDSPLWI